MTTLRYGPGIEITGRVTPEYAGILTPEALGFAARLQRAFGGRRAELLSRRAARQRELDAGKLPDFLPETRAIRAGARYWCWKKPVCRARPCFEAAVAPRCARSPTGMWTRLRSCTRER